MHVKEIMKPKEKYIFFRICVSVSLLPPIRIEQLRDNYTSKFWGWQMQFNIPCVITWYDEHL